MGLHFTDPTHAISEHLLQMDCRQILSVPELCTCTDMDIHFTPHQRVREEMKCNLTFRRDQIATLPLLRQTSGREWTGLPAGPEWILGFHSHVVKAGSCWIKAETVWVCGSMCLLGCGAATCC